MPRRPKVIQAESTVLARAWFVATDNPIVGTDQDAIAFIFQVKENVGTLVPATYGEGKFHHRSSHLDFYAFSD